MSPLNAGSSADPGLIVNSQSGSAQQTGKISHGRSWRPPGVRPLLPVCGAAPPTCQALHPPPLSSSVLHCSCPPLSSTVHSLHCPPLSSVSTVLQMWFVPALSEAVIVGRAVVGEALLLVGVVPVLGGGCSCAGGTAGLGLDYLHSFLDVQAFLVPSGIKMTPYNELLQAAVEFPRLCLKASLPHAFRAGCFSRMGCFYTRLRKIKGLG